MVYYGLGGKSESGGERLLTFLATGRALIRGWALN